VAAAARSLQLLLWDTNEHGKAVPRKQVFLMSVWLDAEDGGRGALESGYVVNHQEDCIWTRVKVHRQHKEANLLVFILFCKTRQREQECQGS
jgi:hypothetical protein